MQVSEVDDGVPREAVFTDGTGRRRRLVTAFGFAAGFALVGALSLAVAGVFGVSPVPLPGLPAGGQAVQDRVGERDVRLDPPPPAPVGTTRRAPTGTPTPTPTRLVAPSPASAPPPSTTETPRGNRPSPKPANSNAAGRNR
ncbi:hypothetical protein Val02_93090 [Virgisporangium aliadipatigenens]|uniref:Uncharacterized protein n=1 Tax=Virgisporangium aliadipatigenens TaxID=741659 RepID=A0A8J4DWM4_9ACTN|nr:hypothetical protein [Virgisporangium aliadipatigenens]GIJ52423.1 hypothetical protein Val02_93090 [Virgisporangium aliadipatigenens]